MNDIQTSLPGLILVRPDPERDAPFAVGWLNSEFGRETMRLMGNADKDISTTTVGEEFKRIKDFLELEKKAKQLTWTIRYDDRSIGVVWVDLHPTKRVKAPALHIMIGDHGSRGKGIGKEVIKTIVAYVRDDLNEPVLYSRHLADNQVVIKMNSSLGFEADGEPYTDNNGLIFQNIKIAL